MTADVPVPGLCLTCLVRVGRPRATVLKAVVCGPCWAAHGGTPDASEIGSTPAVTGPSRDPADQRSWLRELRRQEWVQAVRSDGQGNLLKVAELVALYAQWDTLESRPTWAKLVLRSGLATRTVARWLQELRVRGWLAHLEHGTTPATRPGSLADLQGNRAALYGLRIPLTPEEAATLAGDDLALEVEAVLRNPAPQPTSGTPSAASKSAPELEVFLPGGDRNGTPSWSFKALKKSSTGGLSRARQPVDNYGRSSLNSENNKTTALRAGSEGDAVPDLSIMVPVSGFAMLAVAQWLREQRPGVFGRCSRKLVRHLCRPYWRAGWCARDIVHALDHRPSVFSQSSGVLLSPDHPVSPVQFVRSRLRAWRGPDGVVLPGYWSERVADVAAGRAAQAAVRQRHGCAGSHLLRAGERGLTSDRVAEYGRTCRAQAAQARAQARRADRGTSDLVSATARPSTRAERDQQRAALVARARAELADTAARATATAAPQQPPASGEPATSSRAAYDRALARARGEFGPGTPPRKQQRRSRRWS
jgi:hypothetical protein